MPPARLLPRGAARALGLAAACAGAACAGAACARAPRVVPTAGPADALATAPPVLPPVLPPVPSVRGPLAVRVVHPADGTVLTVDSTFVFGAVGSGDATLTIDGRPVPVADNGAFLAWLPVPRHGGGGTSGAAAPGFTLVAVRGADTARSTLRVRRPVSVPLPATGPLRVDSASVQPRGVLRLRTDEVVPVRVRVPANAEAFVQIARGARVPLVREAVVRRAVERAAGRGGTNAEGPATPVDDAGVFVVGEVRADALDARARLVVARGADTVRLALATPELLAPDAPRRYVLLQNRTGGLVAQSDTDQVVIAQPVPDGFYKWALLPGTQLEVTGRQGAFTRVRLDAQLEAWVATEDLAPLPDGTPAARRVNGGLRVVPSLEWVDVVVPTGARPAFLVEPDDDRLVVTFYDTRFSPSISPMLGTDPLVRQLAWEPLASDRTRLELRLSAPVFGWLALWDETRRAVVLRVRRVPRIDPARPLAGLVLAVDAGHPPGGATGPTGLTEADAALPVAERLRDLLVARGARVVMTRTTREAVALTDRPVLARRAGAHAFLSVHLNAFGDGTNPFVNHGTSTLFFHQPSEPLARAVQQRLMVEIGQRDLGIHYQNLAIARPTWYPSALAEGLFLMFPAQEAAMRTAGWQARYARGIADGVTAYFRALGERAGALAAAPGRD